MDHISRTVESRPGLTQEEALKSLQDHPEFKVGTIIESIKPRGNYWVAQLKEPKVAAEFPPISDEEESESPEEEASESPADEKAEGESDGPPSPPKEKSEDKPEKKEEAQISELVDLVHAIADKLGISPEGPDLGDDAPIGDAPPGPPPPPHGGPGGPDGPGGPPPHAPKKDMPPGAAPLTGFASKKIPSFVASTKDDISIKEAKADLEKEFPGYNVKRINRQGGQIHALLSVR